METSGWKFLKIFAITWEHLRRSKNKNSQILELKESWARELLRLLNIQSEVVGLKKTQDLSETASTILVGNHISYADIVLVLQTFPDCCFVSKKELAYWPIIGKAATKADTIFVQRENKKSRNSVRSQILESLKQEKKNLVIFPSGTTKIGPSERWRKGAFEIAKEGGFKVQPFRIKYSPERPVAYVDDDFFPTHAMRLFKESQVQARIEFGESFHVTDIMADLARAKAWCEEPMEIQ